MKKLKLAFFTILTLGLVSFAFIPKANYSPVFAEEEITSSQPVEEESSFVEKTYVYEEGENKATIVLTSPTELSMTIGEETKVFNYVRKGNIVSIEMGETVVDVQVNDITGTFGEPTYEPVVPSEKEHKILDLFENFVVPAVSAILGVVGVGGIITIIFGLIKLYSNKKANAERKKDMSNIYKNSEESLDVINKAKDDISKASDDIAVVKEEVNNTAKDVIKSNDRIKDNVDKIPTIVKSLIVLSKELAVYISNNPNQVANGAAEEVNKIIEELKDLK